MPGKRRALGGKEVIAIFAKFGFEPIDQRGSHVKLRRIHNGERQTLHVPLHQELARGTLSVIFRQACQYIPAEELRQHFVNAR